MVTKAKTEAENSEPSTEVAKANIHWGEIDNLNDARLALANAGIPVLSSGVLFGDGSEFIKDKDKLVGIPFLVLDWRFIVDEKTKREYVNVLVMNGQGSKARFNDGSTGVYAQLKEVHEQTGVVAIECKMGLRKSEYTTPEGEPATTFYLSA